MAKTLIEQVVRRHLRKLVRLVVVVAKKRDKNIELIHHLRSESRRADAALRFFVGCIPRRRAERIRQRLGRIRKKAGCVRDLDVLMPLLETLAPQMPIEAMQWLRERAAVSQEKNRRSLKRYCKRLLERGFDDEAQLLTSKAHSKQAAIVPNLDEFCCSGINHLVTSFGTSVEALMDDPNQLHAVRILGRRLRYTLDLCKEILPESDTDAACQMLSELQDSIGQEIDQQSMLRFLRVCASECDDEPFAIHLSQLIASLEAADAERVDALIRDVFEKAKDIRGSLENGKRVCE